MRNSVTTHGENKLRDYIEYGGRKPDMPFSYTTVERTFYSRFICPSMLQTPFNHRSDEGLNPRELEVEQIVRLMNLVASKIYIGKFDHMRGTRRIEHDIQQGKDVPDDHLRAYRLAREEIAHTWLTFIHQLVQQFFITTGTPVDSLRLFQYRLPDGCWHNIMNFVDSLAAMPVWVNHQLSVTVFGGKRNHDFWQSIFETGNTPDGSKVLPRRVDLMEMIKD